MAIDTEPGTRARSTALFQINLEKLSDLALREEAAKQRASDARGLVRPYQEALGKKFLPVRLAASLLDFIGVHPIVPEDLARQYSDAQLEHRWAQTEFKGCLGNLEYFGSKLIGEHRLVSLRLDTGYPEGWYPGLSIDLGFYINLPHTRTDRVLADKGLFPNLRYVSTDNIRPRIEIPEDDKESPIIQMPKNGKLVVDVKRQFGIGSWEFVRNFVEWKPRPTSTPKMVNPQKVAELLPIPLSAW